jgi:RNA polymerase sigma-70 factor (ECF subfamily)
MRENFDLNEAVTDVYEALRSPVYSYLVSILGRPSDAEDLAQETFVRLFQELRSGHVVAHVRTWLFRVAHNLAMDRYRVVGLTESSAIPTDYVGQPDPSPTAEERILDQEKYGRLKARLARLSARERQCLELRAQGFRYREIAEIVGIGIPTVQTVLCRVIGKLRDRGE